MARKSLLVIAAHPDDEVLGCGATVALRAMQRWEAHLIVVASGITGRHATPRLGDESIQTALDSLKRDMGQAADSIGFRTWTCLDFPDNRLDTVPRMDIAHALSPLVAKLEPSVVFTQHPGDYNWDHGRTFDAVMMACRANPGDFAPNEIYTFEVLSSTERGWQEPARAFHPNVYVNVARTIDKKKLAMKHYRSEYRAYPHPRSIEGIEYLARKRGLEVGLEYAEAFHLVRSVER